MRFEKTRALLDLARALAGSAEGLTLDEMAQIAGVGRRTAERMRDAIEQIFPQLEAVDDPPYKRFRISNGLDRLFQAPTAEELVALNTTALAYQAAGNVDRANALLSLEGKLKASLRSSALRRLGPDVEALLQAEMVAVQPGPRAIEDGGLLLQLRHALKASREVRFVYAGGSRPGEQRHVVPYGLLFGRTNYLVAAERLQDGPKTWRLDRIQELEIQDTPAVLPPDFNLAEFARRSFGTFHGALEHVVLRVKPDRAQDALRWLFHPSQEVTLQSDGSVLVTFHASGMLELSWHLFSWSDQVEIITPESLRTLMVDELRRALAVHVADKGDQN